MQTNHRFISQIIVFAVAILLLILFWSTYTDCRYRKIYNGVTYPAVLGGLIFNAVADWMGHRSTSGVVFGEFPAFEPLGAIGGVPSFLGGVVCLSLMLVLYSTGGIGGGDVKLSVVLGVFLGLPTAIIVLMLAFVLAAGTILIGRVYHHGLALKKTEEPSGVGPSNGSDAKNGREGQTSFGRESRPETAVPLGAFFAIAFVVLMVRQIFQ